jgi:hypothetical protein
VNDWSTPNHGPLWIGGGFNGTTSLLAYRRDLGGGGLGPYELQVVEVESSTVLFDAFKGPFVNGDCTFNTDAISSAGALFEVTSGTDSTFTKWERLLWVFHPGDMLPSLSEHTIDSWITGGGFIASSFWGLTPQGNGVFLWHLNPPGSMLPGWGPTDGSGIDYLDMQTVGGNLFLSTTSGTLVTWSPDAGAQTLVSPNPPATLDFALATDGTDMVWLQGVGQTGPYTFSAADIMTSSFALSAAGLAPRRLWRSTIQTWGEAIVGGGYALIEQETVVAGQTVTYFTLTRLADGAHWNLQSPMPGFMPSRPLLYVNANEVALGLTAVPTPPADAGAVDSAVVRLQIASLGPPILPDAGDAGM